MPLKFRQRLEIHGEEDDDDSGEEDGELKP